MACVSSYIKTSLIARTGSVEDCSLCKNRLIIRSSFFFPLCFIIKVASHLLKLASKCSLWILKSSKRWKSEESSWQSVTNLPKASAIGTLIDVLWLPSLFNRIINKIKPLVYSLFMRCVAFLIYKKHFICFLFLVFFSLFPSFC